MNNVKKLRDKNGMTLADLSDKTGFTQATLCRIERGSARPHYSTRRTLARILKVTVEELGFDGSK